MMSNFQEELEAIPHINILTKYFSLLTPSPSSMYTHVMIADRFANIYLKIHVDATIDRTKQFRDLRSK